MDINNEPKEDKPYGSTTLQQCGWCKYASGTHRYNYCIRGKCSLDKRYSKDIAWQDECRFINASKSDITAIQSNHKYTIEGAKASIARHKDFINVLNVLKRKAVERPPLPDDRRHDHFNIGDDVVVYFEGEWEFGKVANGYRHHDGCVSYKLDKRGPQESGFWGCGMAVPTVMLKGEWEFFRDNPSEYGEWCKKSYDKDFNGVMLEAPLINNL